MGRQHGDDRIRQGTADPDCKPRWSSPSLIEYAGRNALQGETAMPFYDKGDVRIRYEEAGSGFPLLVMPGGGLNSRISNGDRAPRAARGGDDVSLEGAQGPDP